MMRRLVVIASIAVLATTGILLLGQLREEFAERCTESWDAATTVDVSALTLTPEEVGRVSSVRKVVIGGQSFEVDPSIHKTMGWASIPVNPLHRQRVGVIFTLIGKDEATVKALVPLCMRATLGSDTWERRAHARDTYIRGIAGDAVGGAGAGNGPEWPADAPTTLALLVSLDGQRYVLEATAVPIMRTD